MTSPSHEKTFRKTGTGFFETEAEGLIRIAQASHGLLRVPKVYHAVNDKEIVMEKLDLSASKRPHGTKLLARGLREVHQAPQPEDFKGLFGFPLPGQCGVLNHPNNCERKPCDWVAFFSEYRLGYQLDVLRQREARGRATSLVEQVLTLGRCLLENVHEFFDGAGLRRDEIAPSLLHGDLWDGNWGVVDEGGRQCAAVFDPAPLYGHFEYDFGIGTMFSGPVCKTFYDGYFAETTKAPGFEDRVLLYSVFHHLNHMNIFGAESYGHGALRVLKSLTNSEKLRKIGAHQS